MLHKKSCNGVVEILHKKSYMQTQNIPAKIFCEHTVMQQIPKIWICQWPTLKTTYSIFRTENKCILAPTNTL